MLKGQPKILKTYYSTFGSNYQGYIFPIKIFIDFFFNLSQDFCFATHLIKQSSENDQILIKNDGKLLGFTKGFHLFIQQEAMQQISYESF